MNNQLVPLSACPHQEDRSQQDRDTPPCTEGLHLPTLDSALCQPDEETARQQANRVEDGQLKYLLRRRPTHVAA